MPQYQSFVIAEFKTGYFTAREPWMTPKDAFPVLLDARVDRGYLSKRTGYTELADTGAGYPIMGMHAYMRKGHPVYLVADRKRLYSYAPYAESLTDLSEADTYTGSDRDFFWFQNWRDKCYFCNGVDAIYVFDAVAETLTALNTIGDEDTDIQIESAQMIFRYKSRLIFINPVVDGVWHSRRLYYTDVNTTNVASTNYVDGDMEDVFVSGCYVNGIPTMFGHEGFIATIKYTFNPDTPFSWEEMENGLGTLGLLQPPQHLKQVLRLGHDGLYSWDGYQSKRVGLQIRDFVADIDNLRAWYMNATMRRDREIMYLAYPNNGSASNDRILEFNISEGNFAVHKMSTHCLLGTTGHMIPEITFIDDYSFDNLHDLNVSRHPTYKAMTLMGGHTGKLYLMNSGTDDDGTTISSEVWTAGLNPFWQEGRKTYFGRCYILVGTSSTKSCTVSFYKDLSSTPYKTTTLAADGSGDKHWVTLFPDGEVGNFHRIAFTGDLPDIHAMDCKFARAGNLDAGGSDSVVTIDTTGAPTALWRMVQNDDGELETQKYVGGVWTVVEVTDA